MKQLHLCATTIPFNWSKPQLSLLGLLIATASVAIAINALMPVYFAAMSEREFRTAQIANEGRIVFAYDKLGGEVFGFKSGGAITDVYCDLSSGENIALVNILSKSRSLSKVKLWTDREYEVTTKLRVFESVTDLEIYSYGGISEDKLEDFARSFPNVARLVLLSEFKSPAKMRDLSAFKHLESLCLSYYVEDVSPVLRGCFELGVRSVRIYDKTYLVSDSDTNGT